MHAHALIHKVSTRNMYTCTRNQVAAATAIIQYQDRKICNLLHVHMQAPCKNAATWTVYAMAGKKDRLGHGTPSRICCP